MTDRAVPIAAAAATADADDAVEPAMAVNPYTPASNRRIRDMMRAAPDEGETPEEPVDEPTEEESPEMRQATIGASAQIIAPPPAQKRKQASTHGGARKKSGRKLTIVIFLFSAGSLSRRASAADIGGGTEPPLNWYRQRRRWGADQCSSVRRCIAKEGRAGCQDGDFIYLSRQPTDGRQSGARTRLADRSATRTAQYSGICMADWLVTWMARRLVYSDGTAMGVLRWPVGLRLFLDGQLVDDADRLARRCAKRLASLAY